MTIWVPGTVTSRLQPNFAFAIDHGIRLDIGPEWFEWTVAHNDASLPHDDTNLIATVASTIAPTLAPHQLKVASTLPVGQGLGSSLAATLASITMVEELTGETLSRDEKIAKAAFFEPDPVAISAALSGGGLQLIDGALAPLTIEGIQGAVYLPTGAFEATVPANPSMTPPPVQALATAFTSMDHDWLQAHFPLQAQVTRTYYPHAEMIARAVQACGGFACFAAGNGPALICLAPADTQAFLPKLRDRLTAGKVIPLTISRRGLTISQK